MSVLIGDVVKDLESGFRGVVVEVVTGGAWVEIDSLYLRPYENSRWFLPNDRMIRL